MKAGIGIILGVVALFMILAVIVAILSDIRIPKTKSDKTGNP